MNNSQIGHAWFYASSNESGKNGNGSFYYDGHTVYSYGRHFPIACKVWGKDGEKFVLFNSDTYSVTTSAHQSKVLRAIDRHSCTMIHLPTEYIRTSRPTFTTFKTVCKLLTVQAQESFAKAARARKEDTRAWNIRYGEQSIQAIEDYARLHCFKVPVSVVKFAEAMAEPEGYKEAARVLEASRQREEAAKRRKHAKRIKEWRAGGSSMHLPHTQRALLRLGGMPKEGGGTRQMVQTSQGAALPVSSFKRCWSMALHAIRTGETVTDADLSESCRRALHPFKLYGASPSLISIGCHNIEMVEAKNIAKALGLEVK